MPGMQSGLNLSNPVLVAAFRSALLHQGLSALLALATLAIIWACLREWRPALVSNPGRARPGRSDTSEPGSAGEPAAHPRQPPASCSG